jgi:hypothetical protein
MNPDPVLNLEDGRSCTMIHHFQNRPSPGRLDSERLECMPEVGLMFGQESRRLNSECR